MAGVLYIVATPIGNLEDITLRARRILKEVDLIAAEDTRRTKILLSHYGIDTPLTSYHEHNERAKASALLAQLEKGEDIALVSDAGTPTLSDPGYRLVRGAVKTGVRVVPVPGVSALTAVLSASGLPSDRFVFEGFLPAKKEGRRERLRQLREETRTLVFYEAPHRLTDSLRDLLEILGDREVVLGREVTKVYEEFIRARLCEVLAMAEHREIRGEMTVVVSGSEEATAVTVDQLRREIRRLKQKGMRVKEIAELLGGRYSCPKREIYRLTLEEAKGG
jgi:16S rRNA (cytidine1402-2'-O)-methyltransferase